VSIIGGGIDRWLTSAALSRIIWLNWVGESVILLERKKLHQRTTGMRQALFGTVAPSQNMTRLGKNTPPIFTHAGAETGLAYRPASMWVDHSGADCERQEELRAVRPDGAWFFGCRGERTPPVGHPVAFYTHLNMMNVLFWRKLPGDGRLIQENCVGLGQWVPMLALRSSRA